MVAAAVAAGGYLFGRGAMGADAASGDPAAMPSVPDPMPEVPASRDIFVLMGDRNPDVETQRTDPSSSRRTETRPERDRNPDRSTTSDQSPSGGVVRYGGFEGRPVVRETFTGEYVEDTVASTVYNRAVERGEDPDQALTRLERARDRGF